MAVFHVPGLDPFFTGVETSFWKQYTAAEVWSDGLFQPYPVKTRIWLHGWSDMPSRARMWLGKRKVNQPAALTYAVQMLPPVEDTFGIDAFELGMDQFGIWAPQMALFGLQMRKDKDYRARDLLFGLGFYGTTDRQQSTDGLSHWNTAHPVDLYDASKGTFSNDFTGGGFTVNGVNIGGALSINGFETLYRYMSALKSNNGEALGSIPDLAFGSTNSKAKFATVLKNQYTAAPNFSGMGVGPVGSGNGPFVGMQDNPVREWVDYRVYADFAISTSIQDIWFMAVTKRAGILPFSFGTFVAPTLVPRTAATDPVVFDTHQYVYGFHAVSQPAWGPVVLSARSGP